MVDTQNFKALKASIVIEGFQMNIYNHVFLQRNDKPNKYHKNIRDFNGIEISLKTNANAKHSSLKYVIYMDSLIFTTFIFRWNL